MPVDLQIYKFQVYLKFQQPACLPPYKGSTLRGALALSLKRLVCLKKEFKACDSCLLSTSCPYRNIFEPFYIHSGKRISLPTPLILEPPYDDKRFYAREDNFDFNLILIGRNALEYFPYIVLAIKEMSKTGMGKRYKRGQLKLIKIKNSNRIVYSHKEEILKDTYKNPIKISGKFSEVGKITVRFISPARIKVRGKLTNNLPFSILVQAILRRIAFLDKFYNLFNGVPVDYQDLKARASGIKVIRSRLRWMDWERFSYRQKTLMKLGGIVGEITYAGDFKEFLPLLEIGSVIHIGKNCAFGLGKYEIKYSGE